MVIQYDIIPEGKKTNKYVLSTNCKRNLHFYFLLLDKKKDIGKDNEMGF